MPRMRCRVEVTGIFRAVPKRVTPKQRVVRSVYKTYVDVIHFRYDHAFFCVMSSIRGGTGHLFIILVVTTPAFSHEGVLLWHFPGNVSVALLGGRKSVGPISLLCDVYVSEFAIMGWFDSIPCA